MDLNRWSWCRISLVWKIGLRVVDQNQGGAWMQRNGQGSMNGSHMRGRFVRTCVKVKSHIGKIEKGLDLNIQLDDSSLTRLSLLSGYGSFNVY